MAAAPMLLAAIRNRKEGGTCCVWHHRQGHVLFASGDRMSLEVSLVGPARTCCILYHLQAIFAEILFIAPSQHPYSCILEILITENVPEYSHGFHSPLLAHP
jgi:hypothetical protein